MAPMAIAIGTISAVAIGTIFVAIGAKNRQLRELQIFMTRLSRDTYCHKDYHSIPIYNEQGKDSNLSREIFPYAA